MVSAYVILSEPSERRISFRESEGTDFEQNETLRYAQGDKMHKRLVQSVADHYKLYTGGVMFEEFSREELEGMLRDAALNWLSHDGLWFLAAEDRFDMETAIALDAKAWETFTVIEAKRIMKRHGIEAGGGIPALAKALGRRLYAFINEQEIVEQTDTRLVFRMNDCRVQSARRRKGLPDFPCKPVGIIEYGGFARTIDPRIETRCIGCPPDSHPDEWYCAWEFTLQEGEEL